MTTRGKFITIEGIDGAGKSSHLSHIAGSVRAAGHRAVETREPGGTPLGEALRKLVLHEPMHVRTEATLMFAARSEHLVRVIEPALTAGEWVACDRFTDSTFAYQCGGRGLARDVFTALAQALRPACEPDATFLFDIDPELAARRQQARSATPDRFELEQVDFFRRVRAAYLERAREAPGRIRVIDASGSFEQVRALLDAALEPVLR
jgi:dTMP kinase